MTLAKVGNILAVCFLLFLAKIAVLSHFMGIEPQFLRP